MSHIFAKIRLRGNVNKYRKLLSTDNCVYSTSTELIQSSVAYNPQTLLDESDWYSLEEFSHSEYVIDVIVNQFDTVDYDLLATEYLSKIDYIFTENNDEIYFQNISKSRLVRKKTIFHIGENFRYDDGLMAIVLNEIPDAIYVRAKDILYFRKLASITTIFKGIDQLYREATEDETIEFLNRNFIRLNGNFSSKNVKTANRKRIALALDTLSHLQETERQQVFSYIGEYCPRLKKTANSFEVGSEEDLKLLLFGIEQRFYTTLVGKEKRIANSIIALK